MIRGVTTALSHIWNAIVAENTMGRSLMCQPERERGSVIALVRENIMLNWDGFEQEFRASTKSNERWQRDKEGNEESCHLHKAIDSLNYLPIFFARKIFPAWTRKTMKFKWQRRVRGRIGWEMIEGEIEGELRKPLPLYL